MRDLLVSLIILSSLPFCYRRPIVGLWMFSILAYMRLQDLAWGFAKFQRWSMLVALIMLAGYVAARDKKGPIFELRTILMVFLASWIGLGHFFAQGRHPVNYAGFVEYAKIIFIAVFTSMVVRTREQLRITVWVIALSFGFYGLKNGVAGIAKGGNMYIMRGPGGMLEDNNDFALAMAMSVPLLVGLATSERNETLRKGLWGMVPLAALTVIFTKSRGGALSLFLCTMGLVWRSRNRVIGLMIGALAVGAAAMLVPKENFERLETLKDVEADGSAMGRIRAWKVGSRMAIDNPLFGVGFQRFQMNYLDYEPEPTQEQRAGKGTLVAHNSYIQIVAECGFPALLTYLGLMGLCFFDIWKLRKEAKQRYAASWILSYCTMFEVILATFMLGSAFLNRAHFDLIYHYFAIILVFGQVARKQMQEEAMRPLLVQNKGRRGGPLVVQPASGFGGGSVAGASGAGFRTTPLQTRN